MKRDHYESDIDLVEACINRDLIAWSILVKKYSRLVYASIENRLKKFGLKHSLQDIEDIRQNVMSRLWQDGKLRDVRNRNSIAYWLAIVSGNMALEYARKYRYFEPSRLPLTDTMDEEKIIDIIPVSKEAPDKLWKEKNLRKRIAEAIASLPCREKLIMKLSLFHEKKYCEISRILNMPAGTVSSYIKRAKDKLRKNLKDLQ